MKNNAQHIKEYVRQHGFDYYPIISQDGAIDKGAFAILGLHSTAELVRCADHLHGMIMPFMVEEDRHAARIQTDNTTEHSLPLFTEKNNDRQHNIVGIFVRAEE
ncbi:MAG: hypothetical protein WC716_07335 [Chitinophagaceae bacterium]|jgi:hypothetical protein